MNIVFRNPFKLCDIAFRCIQHRERVECTMLRPRYSFLRSKLVGLVCCGPLPMTFSLNFFKDVETEENQINLRTASSIKN